VTYLSNGIDADNVEISYSLRPTT